MFVKYYFCFLGPVYKPNHAARHQLGRTSHDCSMLIGRCHVPKHNLVKQVNVSGGIFLEIFSNYLLLDHVLGLSIELDLNPLHLYLLLNQLYLFANTFTSHGHYYFSIRFHGLNFYFSFFWILGLSESSISFQDIIFSLFLNFQFLQHFFQCCLCSIESWRSCALSISSCNSKSTLNVGDGM